MDELITEFLTETNESLEELDLDLVNLEQNPNDKELLSKIFRLVHTIKGTCGFLGLPRLEKLAHHAENVLGRFRDGDLAVTPEYVTLIFESIDKIKYIVSGLEKQGSEPEGDDSPLIAKLDAVYEGTSTPEPEKVTTPEKPEEKAVLGMATEAELEEAFRNAPGPEDIPQEPAATAENGTPQSTEGKDKSVSSQTLRVNVDVLENLMTMVSELVLTRNQLLQILRVQTESDFSTPLQRLNHVVSELQEGVMKTRMQPIGNAWSKLPRIIRDLSIDLGKKIDLEMRGQDTELDRQVLELIKDPLTHMVRNSGDHGIEKPKERLAAGKPETGRILLNAYHEGGHINIEISDDGKGLSVKRIKEKILSSNLATSKELEEMTPQQINQFIFKAGFSTAEKVTAVSGRGVGMDVVRNNIEKIGGSIELKSVEGKGSTFIIKIPLTLAIVSALIVESGGERFAIPQLAVRELVMTSDYGDTQIEMIKGTPVFRLRDHLLPLVSLSDLLNIATSKRLKGVSNENTPKGKNEKEDHQITSSEEDVDTTKKVSRNQYVVVTQVGAYDFGIIVDRVFDTEEIVVKPVAKILRDIDLFSGNTILGDGSVIMILDPNGIAKETGEIEMPESMDNAKSSAMQTNIKRKTSLLLFKAGKNAPKAVPLSLVARLENVLPSSIEHSSGQMMVQYRGQLMPLLPFDNSTQIEGEEDKPVLVFTDKDRSMGLIVDEIIDITEEHVDVQLGGDQPGLLGSAIINGKATDVVDVAYYLHGTNTDWFKDHSDEPFSANGTTKAIAKRRVLLVDDSPFFRNMLTPLLNVAGYDVTTLESPIEALKMCERGDIFDVIVSDIEMPDMDGFEFAEKVKAGGNWQNTPMVALSSHATPQDINRGMEVGYSKYVAKFDRDTLLNTISQTLFEHSKHSEDLKRKVQGGLS